MKTADITISKALRRSYNISPSEAVYALKRIREIWSESRQSDGRATPLWFNGPNGITYQGDMLTAAMWLAQFLEPFPPLGPVSMTED